MHHKIRNRAPTSAFFVERYYYYYHYHLLRLTIYYFPAEAWSFSHSSGNFCVILVSDSCLVCDLGMLHLGQISAHERYLVGAEGAFQGL